MNLCIHSGTLSHSLLNANAVPSH